MHNRETFLVDTKLGKVEATPTSGDHVYVSFGGQYSKAPAFTVRGVEYHGNIHLYKYADGSWHIGNEYSSDGKLASDYDKRQSLYLSRANAWEHGKQLWDVSEPARKTIREALELALIVEGWLVSVEGKAALNNARIQQRIEDAARVEEEIAKHESEITKLKLKLATLRS